jgi:hypothetical protein
VPSGTQYNQLAAVAALPAGTVWAVGRFGYEDLIITTRNGQRPQPAPALNGTRENTAPAAGTGMAARHIGKPSPHVHERAQRLIDAAIEGQFDPSTQSPPPNAPLLWVSSALRRSAAAGPFRR